MSNGFLKPGDKVLFAGDPVEYRVKAANDRFAVCTRPYNFKRTVFYTIVDWQKQVRGPDNMIFCAGYETTEDCEARLAELTAGEIEVSGRRSRYVELDIVRVNGLPWSWPVCVEG